MPTSDTFNGATPTRTPETDRRYLKGGRLLLARAEQKAPGRDAVDALVFLCEDPTWTLSPATTRMYRQEVEAVLMEKVDEGSITEARMCEGLARLDGLLKERRGRPPKRTSAKKLKEATLAEYQAILGVFARRVSQSGGLDHWDGVLAKLILIGPYFGLRPVEWLSAQVTGQELIVRNAKHSNGRAAGPVRSIMLVGVPRHIVDNISDLIAGMRHVAKQKKDWGKVLRVLGERLARICKSLEIPRWSLYTVRHIAEATWKRAGLSAAEIAALSGHISVKTARNHYAGGRHGWSAEFACARPAASLVVMIERHTTARLATQDLELDTTADETTNFSPR